MTCDVRRTIGVLPLIRRYHSTHLIHQTWEPCFSSSIAMHPLSRISYRFAVCTLGFMFISSLTLRQRRSWFSHPRFYPYDFSPRINTYFDCRAAPSLQLPTRVCSPCSFRTRNNSLLLRVHCSGYNRCGDYSYAQNLRHLESKSPDTIHPHRGGCRTPAPLNYDFRYS